MKKPDVLKFAADSELNLLGLHENLASQKYRHGPYESFYVCDPKRRRIHKAKVIDRVLHHVTYRVLYPFFDRKFIFDSYSSRKGKGTHAAIARFEKFARALSKNNTKTVWILKCDIHKFFDSVNHEKLISFLKQKIYCEKTISLLENIIKSFQKEKGKGIPLGNLTSQLFSNAYMNPFDQFVKRELKYGCYVRYADDFIFLSDSRLDFERILPFVRNFLSEKLNLMLHDRKIEIRKWHQGVDFLGYISFPHHRILRIKTKRRLIRKINFKNAASYNGVLSHCRSFGIKKKLVPIIQQIENNIL